MMSDAVLAPIGNGVWWLRSERDPRWTVYGRAYVGGFEMPDACKAKLAELKAQLGEPPDDLGWGYEKD